MKELSDSSPRSLTKASPPSLFSLSHCNPRDLRTLPQTQVLIIPFIQTNTLGCSSLEHFSKIPELGGFVTSESAFLPGEGEWA
ncbi:unnamed protein product [Lactuca virosa]|uniref:Uncharacterized protein n=1 Tax=Lactuca virosa TaxID=75947 RepID=A0AAU9PK67_9ASTR|nr:unnamed protein product [Lactuca virosa]